MIAFMKIWIQEEKTASHHIVHLNLEHHGNFEYLGDLDEKEQEELLLKIKPDINVEHNLKALRYYGYLHLLVIIKN
jgi:hypothetical protein